MQIFEWHPLTDSQILNLQPKLEPGEYDFKVIDAEFSTSKAGYPMVKLKLKIWDTNGKEYMAYDWLVAMDSMIHKTKKFWASIGKAEMYEAGSCLESDFINGCGRVKTTLKPSQDGESMNINIVNYIPLKKPEINNTLYPISELSKGRAAAVPVATDDLDDDIPF